MYTASFPDGSIAEYTAKKIAESIYQNINDDGTDELFFDSIIGHGVQIAMTISISHDIYDTPGIVLPTLCIMTKNNRKTSLYMYSKSMMGTPLGATPSRTKNPRLEHCLVLH
jgi:hypothetical protein